MMKLNRREVLAGSSALAASSMFSAPAFSQRRDLTIVSGSQIHFVWNRLINEVFIPEANALASEAGHELNWRELYGTTVQRGGEIQAVRDGLADLAFVTITAYVSELPLQNVTYAVPFGPSEMGVVAAAIHELNRTDPDMAATLQRYGQTYIAPLVVPSYHLWTNFPVNSVEDIRGVKLGSSGLTSGWLQGTGAVPVESHFPGFYNDIQNGVYDGALTWLYVGDALNLVEVAPYVTMVSFGAVCPSIITVSNELWNSSEDLQHAFLTAGERWMEACVDEQNRMEAAAREKIEAAGGMFRDVSEEERAEWAGTLDEVPLAWATAVEESGLGARDTLKRYLDVLKANGITLPRQWNV